MNKLTPVLICGSRVFNNTPIMAYVMGPTILPILHTIEIVHGDASGADLGAHYFAEGYGIPHKRFDAHWDLFGKGAGFIRNEEMADYCAGRKGYCFAFSVDNSRGTADMVRRAQHAGLTTIVHECMPREFYFRKLIQEWQDKFKTHAHTISKPRI